VKSGKQKVIKDVRFRARLESGWRRGIGLMGLALAVAIVSPAQEGQASPDAVKFTSLFSFDGTDGQGPTLNLVQGFDGNLYGTAGGVGSSNPYCTPICGVLFKLTPDGVETTVHDFCSHSSCADGSDPGYAQVLALGTDGSLYGTTSFGGPSGTTVFRLTPSGELKTIYYFGAQGSYYDGVVRGADGSFYGVTPGGGNSNPSVCASWSPDGVTCGTAYKITPQGEFSVIYNFCSQPNCADGGVPLTQLTAGGDGELYGMTVDGGANSSGTVFKLTPGGKLTVLQNLGGTNGGNCFDPCAPLVYADNGNVYGMTQGGGANGAGTFFEITPAGTFTTLYSFCSQANCTDGANPLGFVHGNNGNFYGTTSSDATYSTCGTLFEITKEGKLTTLHTFSGTDGCNPSGVMQHTNGSFYGETDLGGTSNNCGGPYCGSLFALSVGLKPFVETVESSGKVGSIVQILGDDLTSATGVTFNGTAAAFTVESATLISATVPAGATTGFVEVTTSSRTLKSNVKFHVRP